MISNFQYVFSIKIINVSLLHIKTIQGFEKIIFIIKKGAKGDSNPRPLAPKARIIPLDHWPL